MIRTERIFLLAIVAMFVPLSATFVWGQGVEKDALASYDTLSVPAGQKMNIEGVIVDQHADGLIMRGTGGDRQLHPILPRVIDQFPHTGQRRLAVDLRQTLLAHTGLQRPAIEGISGQRGQMGNRLEARGGCPTDDLPPRTGGQLLPVLPVNLLPDEQLGGFRVEDQSIEVEDER